MKPAHSALAILLAAQLAAPGFAATLYKWTDAQGRVHYGDAPPTDGSGHNVQEKRYTPGVTETAVEAKNRIAEVKQPVTLFTSDCGEYCDNARKLLDQRGVRYGVKDPQASTDALAQLERITGRRTIPVLVIGDQHFDGFNASQWNAALDVAGYTKPKGSTPVTPADEGKNESKR